MRKLELSKFVGAGNFNLPAHAAMHAHSPVVLAHAGALGVGAGVQIKNKDRKKKDQKKANNITAASIGGAGGALAYEGAGIGVKHINRALTDKKVYNNPKTHRAVKDEHGNVVKPAYKKPEYKEAMEGLGKPGRANYKEGHKHKHGFHNPDMKMRNKKGFTRDYPKVLPGSRVVRILGRTHHGKTGLLLSTAAAAGGAAVGVHEAKKLKLKKPEKS